MKLKRVVDRQKTTGLERLKALALEVRSDPDLDAAMTDEIAIRELEAGRRLPAARRSLRRFLGA